jgi:hypothetical protein
MDAKFSGKPLVEIPKEIPSAGFLESDFGKEFLEEYNSKVKIDYGNHSNLKVLTYDNGIVVGSNSFAVVLANQILNQEGLRTATQADLERILKTKALQLRGTYEDSGLVLRSEDGANKYIAGNLAKQLRARDKKVKFPVLVNLTDLELVQDKDSDYGLAFKLIEGAKPIYAPILNKPGNFNSEDIDEKTGLPKQISKGDRTLYTRSNGLSRLYLGRYLYLSSNNDYLADSNSVGRVVVVSGKATVQNFAEQIEKEYQNQLTDLNNRKENALKVLKGEIKID